MFTDGGVVRTIGRCELVQGLVRVRCDACKCVEGMLGQFFLVGESSYGFRCKVRESRVKGSALGREAVVGCAVGRRLSGLGGDRGG